MTLPLSNSRAPGPEPRAHAPRLASASRTSVRDRAAEIKALARGRWLEILPALGGIDAQLLDRKHHPCPRCGGKDRFRLIEALDGAVLCGQCFREKNGDGFAALMWLRSWTFPEALDAVAHYLGENREVRPQKKAPEAPPTAFDSEAAWLTCEVAVRRAGELRAASQHAALRFLAGRGLLTAIEREPMWALCGIVDATVADKLPPAIRSWPSSGYQLVAGLWNVTTGDLQAVQGRDVTGKARLKVMTPRGSTVAGSVFANPAGRDLLRGEIDAPVVVLGEGLTDSIALSLAMDAPTLCVPGVTMAAGAIGPWAKGRTVLLALDTDEPSEAQVAPVTAAVAAHGGRARRMRWPDKCKDACDALLALGLDAMRARMAALAGKAGGA